MQMFLCGFAVALALATIVDSVIWKIVMDKKK